MDLPLEELQALTLSDVLKESVSIPRASPRTFALITLTLVFPLSFAILAHTLFTHPIIQHIHHSSSAAHGDGSAEGHQWALLFLYQFLYLLFLFTFSLLSTAAVVFTVASIYAAKPVSFSSTLSAIPPVFFRLFRTFLWVSLLMLVYNIAFALALVAVLLLLASPEDDGPSLGSLFFLTLIFLTFLAVHVYITAIWHLASVVTVLEPVCGLTAMRKSRDLLKGKTRMALGFVLVYLGICGLIGALFGVVVVRGGEEGGIRAGPVVRVVVGGALVALLVVVNLVGLLVQSVFYYVCKSYHHQAIDKSALYDHLGGYLGEYVPLKSSIQMESFEL